MAGFKVITEGHEKMNRHFHRWFLLLLFVGSALSAFAQTAQFSGRVSDPQQARVRGAQVLVVNQATDIKYEATTNADGFYVVPFVPPGTYKLFVTAKGFSIAMSEPLTVTVGQELVFDVQLKIGSVEQTVTVNGGSQLLNTTDGSVSTVIDQQFVGSIPLNGRSFQDLISMTPGVVTQSPQISTSVGTRQDFSVNGQRTESNNYIVDGVSANVGAGGTSGTPTAGTGGTLAASTALGTTQSLISVDALQEFRVESSSYSAEYGRSPGGQFSFISRSGTNTFHGSAYDYLRNNYFDANNWFNDYYHTPEPSLHQNDFGGTLGGPIRIPKLYNGKDKTFFFVSYEGLRLMQPLAASAQYVPSLSVRQSGPAALLPILNAYPKPTGNEILVNGVPSGLAPFNKASSLPSEIDSTSVRLDHNLSSRMSVFFRYGYTPSKTETRTESMVTGAHFDTLTYTGGITNQLSSKVNNSFRFGYAKSTDSKITTLDGFGGATPIDLAQATGLGAYPNAYPSFYLSIGGVGTASLFTSRSSNEQHQWNLVDSLSLSLGRHQLKFGFDYRRLNSPLAPAGPNATLYYLNATQLETNQPQLTAVNIYAGSEPVFSSFGLFAQDEWHVAPRLTLSLGLRWEVAPPPSAANGLDPFTLTGNISNPSSLALAPRGTALWQTAYLNFAPRLGVAWQARTPPGWETVVRVGGGVFFDTDDSIAAGGFQGLGFKAGAVYSNAGFPVTPAQLNITPSTSAPYTSATVYAFPVHLQLPYTLQWNLSVQQALGKSQSLTMSYLGSAGRRLPFGQSLSLSAFNKNFSTVSYAASDITSDYDALQLQFQRQLHRSIQALASYTWSHSIDIGSGGTSYSVARGNSDFDVRHNLQAGLSWELPGVENNRLGEMFLSHWGLDGRLIARSGFPLNITTTGSSVDPVTGELFYDGVNFVPGQPVWLYGAQCTAQYKATCPGGRALNPNAFVSSKSILGTVPRNFFRGFGENQINLAIRREFPIEEGFKLQFRAEAFNVLNHPNFGNINTNIGTATFGQSTAMLNTSLGTVAPQYQQGGPRSMQFALKLLF